MGKIIFKIWALAAVGGMTGWLAATEAGVAQEAPRVQLAQAQQPTPEQTEEEKKNRREQREERREERREQRREERREQRGEDRERGEGREERRREREAQQEQRQDRSDDREQRRREREAQQQKQQQQEQQRAQEQQGKQDEQRRQADDREQRRREREAQQQKQQQQEQQRAQEQQGKQDEQRRQADDREQRRREREERRESRRDDDRERDDDRRRREVVAPPIEEINPRGRADRERRRKEIERAIERDREAAREERRQDRIEERLRRQDERLRTIRERRKERRERDGRIVIEEPGRRFIYREGGRDFIRADETDRLRLRSRDSRSERLPNGDRVITIIRPDGVRIITVVDARGRPLRRIRRLRNGREFVLFENRRSRSRDFFFQDYFVDLPPLRPSIPRERYIVDAEEASEEDIYDALGAAPLERLDRGYSLDEVLTNVRLRERMRSVDLNTITFDFGSWDVAPDQSRRLEIIASVLANIIKRNPDEVFLLEGHTDAVGSEIDNLTLSDRRAESVARILTQEFDVPPENLVTQGYGEQFLKIQTELPERENRRVTVRRISPLLSSDIDEDRRSDRGGGDRYDDDPDYDRGARR